MYPPPVFTTLTADTVPEIQRSSLTTTVLTLKSLAATSASATANSHTGVVHNNSLGDPFSFAFLDPPSFATLAKSVLSLAYLGAIDRTGQYVMTTNIVTCRCDVVSSM